MIRLTRSPPAPGIYNAVRGVPGRPVAPRTSRGSEQRLPTIRISFPVRIVRTRPVRRLPLN